MKRCDICNCGSFDGEVQAYCRTDLEVTADDNTGDGILLDEATDDLFAFFTCTGSHGTQHAELMMKEDMVIIL